MKDGVLKSMRILGFVGSLSLLISACGGSLQMGVAPPAPQITPTDTNLSTSAQAFSKTLYPVVKDHCSNCHSDMASLSSRAAPFFANPFSAGLSHDALLDADKVDFDDPRSSRLAAKVYQGHNCWSGNCVTDGNEILAQINAWASVVQGSKTGPTGFVTAEQTIPANLPVVGGAMNTPITMTFDISSLNSDIPANSSVSFKIIKFDRFSYQISDLRIKSSIDLRVTNVTIYINNSDARPRSSFSLIDALVYSNTVLGTSVSSATILASLGNALPTNPDGSPSGGPGVDKIAVGFFNIARPPDPQAARFEAFRNLMRDQCDNCHMNTIALSVEPGRSSGTVPAFGTFTSPSDYLNQSYNGTAQRFLITPRVTLTSALWRSVAHGTTPAGTTTARSYTEIRRAMPPGSASADRLAWEQIIAAWINGLP